MANGGVTTNSINITVNVQDTTPPQIAFGGLTAQDGAIITTGNTVEIQATASDANFVNMKILLFNSANTLLLNTTTTSTTLHITPSLPSADTYHFYAVAFDSAGNSNQTETRNVIFAPVTSGYSGNSTSSYSQPPATTAGAQLVGEQTNTLVNLESNPVSTLKFSYHDANGQPLTANSASADVLDENGTVIRSGVVVTPLGSGIYQMQQDWTGIPQGTYQVKVKMDDTSYDGITAKVTASCQRARMSPR